MRDKTTKIETVYVWTWIDEDGLEGMIGGDFNISGNPKADDHLRHSQNRMPGVSFGGMRQPMPKKLGVRCSSWSLFAETKSS